MTHTFRLFSKREVERAENYHGKHRERTTTIQKSIKRANCRKGFRGPIPTPSLAPMTAFDGQDVDYPPNS